VWASVNSLPSDGCPLPFQVSNPAWSDFKPEYRADSDLVNIETLEDVYSLFDSWTSNPQTQEKLFGSWDERRYEYANLCGISGYIIDSSFQDVLFMRQYCKSYNVPPFEGGFNSQPKWWIEAMMVIDRAEGEAMRYRSKKNG